MTVTSDSTFHALVTVTGDSRVRDVDPKDGGERRFLGRRVGEPRVSDALVRPRSPWLALRGALGQGGRLVQIISDLVRKELATSAGRTADNPEAVMPREVVVQYVVGAYMAVLTWWLDRGAKLPPQQMDAMFRRLTNQGVMLS